MKPLLNFPPSFLLLIRSIVALSLLLLFGNAWTSAATIEVTELLAPVTPGTEVPGAWYLSTQAAGTGSLQYLGNAGGDLQNNVPLGQGAALMTTDIGDVNDRARITTADDFGDATTVLGSINLGYDYYKETVGGGNVFAAPSFRIAIFSLSSGAGGSDTDSFGELVYEPTWNQPSGGSAASPADAWQSIAIDPDTGEAGTPSGGDDTNTAGWWWTGGFGQPSGAGGPPIRSLNEWVALFAADDDFAEARVVNFSVGVGTYNEGQVGYFDAVSIEIPDVINDTFDFEGPIPPQPLIPEPSTFLLASLGLLGLAIRRRRRR